VLAGFWGPFGLCAENVTAKRMMKGLDIKIKNWTYSQKEGRAELFD